MMSQCIYWKSWPFSGVLSTPSLIYECKLLIVLFYVNYWPKSLCCALSWIWDLLFSIIPVSSVNNGDLRSAWFWYVFTWLSCTPTLLMFLEGILVGVDWVTSGMFMTRLMSCKSGVSDLLVWWGVIAGVPTTGLVTVFIWMVPELSSWLAMAHAVARLLACIGLSSWLPLSLISWRIVFKFVPLMDNYVLVSSRDCWPRVRAIALSCLWRSDEARACRRSICLLFNISSTLSFNLISLGTPSFSSLCILSIKLPLVPFGFSFEFAKVRIELPKFCCWVWFYSKPVTCEFC